MSKCTLLCSFLLLNVMWSGWLSQAGEEGDDRGWDGWMASPTQWTWVWVDSGSWWWTGRPGVLRFMGSQRVWLDWATELNGRELGLPHSRMYPHQGLLIAVASSTERSCKLNQRLQWRSYHPNGAGISSCSLNAILFLSSICIGMKNNNKCLWHSHSYWIDLILRPRLDMSPLRACLRQVMWPSWFLHLSERNTILLVLELFTLKIVYVKCPEGHSTYCCLVTESCPTLLLPHGL